MPGSKAEDNEITTIYSIFNVPDWLKNLVSSNDPDIEVTIYFSLFLVIFPIITFIWYLWSAQILISIPLILMIGCGLLSYRAARAIETMRGN